MSSNQALENALWAYHQKKRTNNSPNRSGHRNEYLRLLNEINKALLINNEGTKNVGVQAMINNGGRTLQRQNQFPRNPNSNNAEIKGQINQYVQAAKNALTYHNNKSSQTIRNIRQKLMELNSNKNVINSINDILRQSNVKNKLKETGLNMRSTGNSVITNFVNKKINANKAKQQIFTLKNVGIINNKQRNNYIQNINIRAASKNVTSRAILKTRLRSLGVSNANMNNLINRLNRNGFNTYNENNQKKILTYMRNNPNSTFLRAAASLN
jgi:hypothetical protein